MFLGNFGGSGVQPLVTVLTYVSAPLGFKPLQLADSLVKGWETRIPAMKGTEWEQFRWWLNYLQGYEMF